jgi:hypothetical protein
MKIKPYILKVQSITSKDIGTLCISERIEQIPFSILRVFWLVNAGDQSIRGCHAHKVTEQVLFALKGVINVKLVIPDGEQFEFELCKADEGLYIPPNAWHEMTYTHEAIQLVLASSLYDESDYLRNFDSFKQYYNDK